MSQLPQWDDPCETYRALRETYMRIIQGTQESEVEYQGNGVTRRVRFTQGSLDELKRAMDQAKAECEEATGVPRSRRFAITGGFRRGGW